MSNPLGTGSQTTTTGVTTTGTSGSTSAGTSTQTGTAGSATQLPDWLTTPAASIANSAANIANTAYTPYTGQLTAGLSGNQTGGINMAGQNTWSPDISAAMSQFGAGTGTWNNTVAKQYMNPYVMQALNPQLDYMKQQYVEQQNALADKAAAEGAFGGSRAALLQSQQQNYENSQLAGLVGQGYSNAYTTGMSGFEQDQARQIQAAQGEAQLAGLQMQGQQQQYNQLMNSGQVQQTTQQNALNAQYQQFLNAQQWPTQQATAAAGILAQLPHGQTTNNTYNLAGTTGNTATGTTGGTQNTVYTTPGPNGLGQVAGAAASVTALLSALGMSSPADFIAKYGKAAWDSLTGGAADTPPSATSVDPTSPDYVGPPAPPDQTPSVTQPGQTGVDPLAPGIDPQTGLPFATPTDTSSGQYGTPPPDTTQTT
jgi:hypothetical protein